MSDITSDLIYEILKKIQYDMSLMRTDELRELAEAQAPFEPRP